MFKDELWLAVECLLGGAVETILDLYALKEKHVRYIARHVTQALEFLHESGIAFLNLDSSHVMFDLKGNVKLIDMSRAQSIDLLTRKRRDHTIPKSSVFYIPPEFTCPSCSQEANTFAEGYDIWSLGIFIMEMLLRKKPVASSVRSLWIMGGLCKEHHALRNKIGKNQLDVVERILRENNWHLRATSDAPLEAVPKKPREKGGGEEVEGGGEDEGEKEENSLPSKGSGWSAALHDFLDHILQVAPHDRKSCHKLLRSLLFLFLLLFLLRYLPHFSLPPGLSPSLFF